MGTARITKSFKATLIALVAAAGLIAGFAGTAGAIVNGTESASGARTYQVSVQNEEGHFCGGTVINATTVVTAAHCLEGEGAGLTVRAGFTDLDSNNGQTVPVASFTSHPDYDRDGLADIAIVRLATPLTLGGDVTAIPLATAAEVTGATTGTVSGWGATSEDGDSSSTLLEANVPLVSDASCQSSVGADAQTEVCAGGTGTDSCYGDSGGPLVISTDRGTALAGVVSWGEECGGSTPGVYADVPGLTTWINNNADGPATPVGSDPGSDPADEDSLDSNEFDGEFDDDGYFDDDLGSDTVSDTVSDTEGEFDEDGYWVDEYDYDTDEYDYDDDFDGEFDEDGYWVDEYDFDADFDEDGYWDDEYDFDADFDEDGYWDDEYDFEYDYDAEFDDEGYWMDEDY